MLRFLAIRHLAVIDHLEVEFVPGLTVLTGETGAGKSMLVEAIDLLVGGRASADLVRTGESTASIQAIFERPDGREVIVRREISSQGRSRAFIDDALATTAALRELGASMVDLHGQHEHQTLLNPQEHAGLVDEYAAHDELTADVARLFAGWKAYASALQRTQLSDRDKAARIEWIVFQLTEFDRVAPTVGEDDRLANERQLLANSDRLGRLSTEAYASLYDGDGSALEVLAVVWKRLDDLAAIDARFQPYADQRDDVKARLEDLAFMLRAYSNELDASPERLQQVEDRLAALERLKKKHGSTLDAVLATCQAFQDELAALEANEERAVTLARQAEAAGKLFRDRALDLSASRQAAAARLARSLEKSLAQLAMPQARVEVRVHSKPESQQVWSASGVDEIEFFFSPNPGEDVRPLARIASGGELSRVMLALKTLAAPDERGRTLIFDEVDTGIGGAAADAVGARLQTLGERFQVLCITHLPQIAARGSSHLHIAKEVRGGRTITVVTRLDTEEREREIARMIAGAEISDQVVASAREMLAARRQIEQTAKGESESRLSAKAKGPEGKKRGA
ncbi:MAG: DNA repair protein RecN [Vicinamibacterales bacterium]